MLYVGLTIKVKVGIPENFKVGWYPHKITGLSHLSCRTPWLKFWESTCKRANPNQDEWVDINVV